MQHSPSDPDKARSPRSGRAQPALSTTPVYISAANRQNWPQLPARQKSSSARHILFSLIFLGLLSGFCVYLCYPLFFVANPGAGAARALTSAFPWLTGLFWTSHAPWLVAFFARVAWLDLRTGSATAAANLLLLILALAFGLLFLASRVCQKAVSEHLGYTQMRRLLLLIWIGTLILGSLFVFLPGGFSQNILLSALYGRLIAVYHVNPYLASPGLLVHDSLYRLLIPGTFVTPQAGPLWLDLTVPLAWLTQGNPAFAFLSFRLLGLLLHLFNVLLLWAVLTKLKPEARLVGTLLYAWNPIVLLLGVSEMRAESVVIFLLLLGAFFFQRRVLVVGWSCLLLAALVNPLCLLLLPLFLRMLARETRTYTRRQRVIWWIGLLVCVLVLVVLAYAPYQVGQGIDGYISQLRQVFWPETAQYSLLAAFADLPFASSVPTTWLLTPLHWLLLPALVVGAILLMGIWVTDNLELALLFSSWILLALALLWPTGSPWAILLSLALALASSSRRTSLLAHLLTLGAILTCYWLLIANQWSGQALITLGLPALIWGWTLFFLSTWEMTHREEEAMPVQVVPKRRGLSRPSWPSRPAAWPSRPGRREF